MEEAGWEGEGCTEGITTALVVWTGAVGPAVAGWVAFWKVKGFSSHRVQTVVLVMVMVLVPVTGTVKVSEPEMWVEVVTGQVVVTMVRVLVVPGFTGVWDVVWVRTGVVEVWVGVVWVRDEVVEVVHGVVVDSCLSVGRVQVSWADLDQVSPQPSAWWEATTAEVSAAGRMKSSPRACMTPAKAGLATRARRATELIISRN
jgi:hypothetical protein